MFEPTDEDLMATEAWIDQEQAALLEKIIDHPLGCGCLDCLEYKASFYRAPS